MKLKTILMLSLIALGLTAQAADYQAPPGQVKNLSKADKTAKHGNAPQGITAAQQAMDRYQARMEEEKANGGATPPVHRRMPLNQ